MAKRSIGEIRRAELSQAAFDELVVSGIRGTTLDRVAARAGVSKGVVLHHFKDKGTLFEAVMRRANAVLADGVIELLHHADTPMERLFAIIVGNFAAPIFNQQICHAWISLCADAPYNTEIQRIQTLIQSRMRSNLLSALRDIAPDGQAELFADQLSVTIDGVWLRASLRDEPMSMREGVDHVAFNLVSILGRTAPVKKQAVQAQEKMETLAKLVLSSKAFTDKALAVQH